MTPARIWPDGFDGPSVPALVEWTCGHRGVLHLANDHSKVRRGRVLTLDAEWVAFRARIKSVGWADLDDDANRGITVSFERLYRLAPPPPWPSPAPDWRPAEMIPEDFHA